MQLKDKDPFFIGEIDFRDLKVKVFHDFSSTNKNVGGCVWRMRNPDSVYTGLMYQDETGKITYPDGVDIPEQTEKDKEIIPLSILTGYTNIEDEFIILINKYLNKEYNRRNNINI